MGGLCESLNLETVIGSLWHSTSVFVKLSARQVGAAGELRKITWIESVKVRAIRAIVFWELKSARHAGLLL